MEGEGRGGGGDSTCTHHTTHRGRDSTLTILSPPPVGSTLTTLATGAEDSTLPTGGGDSTLPTGGGDSTLPTGGGDSTYIAHRGSGL